MASLPGIETLTSISRLSLLALVMMSSYFLYLVYLITYRLYLSPLAKYPGPKLTALTGWYEAYYELVKGGGGQFVFQIKKWHEKYGPIIRINPHELHIHDPNYWEVIYSTSTNYDKMKSTQYRFGAPHATFSTPEHEIHRHRRAALLGHFSKRKISQYSPYIQGRAEKICTRLADEHVGTGRILRFNDLWACFVSDVITNFSFRKNYEFIDYPDFKSPFTHSIDQLQQYAHVGNQFPWLFKILDRLPDSVVTRLQPMMRSIREFQGEMRALILGVRRTRKLGIEDETKETVFNELMDSNLSPEDLSLARLQDEAVSLIGAGIESTRWTLTLACYHILDQPSILARLQKELRDAIPDQSKPLPLSQLEQLPYLAAVVEEAVRLSYGAIARSPRVSKDKPFHYGSWIIPIGVPVSMDAWHMHTDETIFPDSFAYRPERWLENPRGPDSKKYLTRYNVSFGRGTRICIGMHLANAELYIAIATLFRRFRFSLFETDKSCVDVYKDLLGPIAAPGNQGVRVLVNGFL